MRCCIVLQKMPGPAFLKLRPIAISLVLLTSGHSKFDLLPNSFEHLPSILLFRKLKAGLSVRRMVTTLALPRAFYATQTHLFLINTLYRTHFSTYQTLK
jgi:hypothetical protein